ncbi:7497_t:CDS:2, partial [Paraglomus occultum]
MSEPFDKALHAWQTQRSFRDCNKPAMMPSGYKPKLPLALDNISFTFWNKFRPAAEYSKSSEALSGIPARISNCHFEFPLKQQVLGIMPFAWLSKNQRSPPPPPIDQFSSLEDNMTIKSTVYKVNVAIE